MFYFGLVKSQATFIASITDVVVTNVALIQISYVSAVTIKLTGCLLTFISVTMCLQI